MSKIRVKVMTKWQRTLERDIKSFTRELKQKEIRYIKPQPQKRIMIEEINARKEMDLWSRQFKEIMLDKRS